MSENTEILKMFGKFMERKGIGSFDLVDRFTYKYSCKEMFTYLWDMKDAHEHLTPKIVFSGKSETEAEQHRVEGNRFFLKKDLDKALASYNQSIMAAPHPPHKPRKCDRSNAEDGKNPESLCTNVEKCNLISETQYKSLALAFANRSAVLFEQKEYKKSLADIELSLQYGYPKELEGKLALRKAKCLFALKQHLQVEEVVKTSLKELQFTTPNETQYEKTKNEMSVLLEKCHFQGNAGVKSIASVERDDFGCKPYLFPELQEVNPSIPSLSSSITMTFSPVKGRMLTAVKNIRPGDLLGVEESFAWSLNLDSCLSLYCSECLATCRTPLPCPQCSLVIFCSHTCCKQGLEGDHGRECFFILPTLKALGETYLLQLYRTMTRIPFSKLRQMLPQLVKETLHLKKENRGYNENGVFDSKDFRTIYHIENNKDCTVPFQLLNLCITSFIVMKVLEQSHEFFTVDGMRVTPTQKDLVLIGTELFRHTLALHQNAHHLSKYQRNTGKIDIGVGIFSAMSLICHSCNPSAMFISHGKYGVLKALRSIPAGGEVSIGYINFLVKPLIARQVFLSKWNFICDCEACHNNWPVMSKLPIGVFLKCLTCHQLFSMEGDCPRCLQDSQRSQNNNMKLVLERLILKDPEVGSETNDSSVRVNIAIAIIEFMERYAETLCFLYHNAICTLKEEFSLESIYEL